jgi:hypothetical protein
MTKGADAQVLQLRLPRDILEATVQQQVLFVAHQLVDLIASPGFHHIDGVSIRVVDPAQVKPLAVLVQIGAEPSNSSIVLPKNGIIVN